MGNCHYLLRGVLFRVGLQTLVFEEMGCTSVKQVPAAANGDEGQNRSSSNGELHSDELQVQDAGKEKSIGGDESGTDESDVTEKSALLSKRRPAHQTRSDGNDGKVLSVHSSESQQEFFKMLDEKIEKGRDYCSEDDDVT